MNDAFYDGFRIGYPEYKLTETIVNDSEELWKEIAIAVAGSGNSIDKKSAVYWADYIVEEYKKRFIDKEDNKNE